MRSRSWCSLLPVLPVTRPALTLALGLWLCAMPTGCGGGGGKGRDAFDASSGSPDRRAASDAPAKLDTGGVKPDGTPATGDGTKPLSCTQIMTCVQQCSQGCASGPAGAMCTLGCNTDCSAKGCAASKSLYGNLSNCITQKCLTECLGGGAPCQTCIEQKCTAEVQQCTAGPSC